MTALSKWSLYDALIEATPANAKVIDFVVGLSWLLVKSELGVGCAMRPLEGATQLRMAGEIIGRSLRDVAAQVKSWDNLEAALGMAAINSALNQPSIVAANPALAIETPTADAFDYLIPQMRGKKVAVIGHFHRLERVADVCQLSILERLPQPGDFPDPACEYILEEQDFVIVTATTLINKTFPRLAELSRNAHLVMCGPTSPFHPVLFDWGVEMLGGLMIPAESKAWQAVQQGGQMALFKHGSQMVKVFPATVAAAAI